ncbi:MAG: DoxX family protein [Candidatus Nitrosopolaris sp.]
MEKVNKTAFPEKLVKYGPLPIRVLTGIIFIAHGIPKLIDIPGTENFFSHYVLGFPPEMAVVIALLEVIGGLALLFGVLTRIAAILFIIEMIGATLTVKLSKGFVSGYDFDLLLVAASISLLLTGPGKPSIEWNLLKREIFPRGKEMVYSVRREEE